MVDTFEPSQVITVTDEAAAHFARQLTKTGKQSIRLSLKESGCTGFMYVIEETDTTDDADLHITLNNDINFYIDTSNLDAINGTVVDYRLEGINRNLIMDNPNVKHACGCGESFNV